MDNCAHIDESATVISQCKGRSHPMFAHWTRSEDRNWKAKRTRSQGVLRIDSIMQSYVPFNPLACAAAQKSVSRLCQAVHIFIRLYEIEPARWPPIGLSTLYIDINNSAREYFSLFHARSLYLARGIDLWNRYDTRLALRCCKIARCFDNIA